jgi:hypothetical protein
MDFDCPVLDRLLISDESKSENGIPVVIGLNAKGEEIVMFVAEAGSARHERTQKKYAAELERHRHNPALRDEIVKKVIAESILVSWTGVVDANGDPIEPTVENKLQALKKYRKLHMMIMETAIDSARFRKDLEEETEKN